MGKEDSMTVLFVNAAFRKNSRTNALAQKYLATLTDKIETVNLGEEDIRPLQKTSLEKYCKDSRNHDFDDEMYRYAKQFAKADEIVIAAPFWNFGLPAVLHAYLELVCTQGLTFDLNKAGEYYSLCQAKKLSLILTAGGNVPENDCAISFIRTLCKEFWNIEDVQYYYADGIDLIGADVNAKLEAVMKQYGNS